MISTLSFCPDANEKKGEDIMAKVQVLAVLSLDGCLSEKTGDASWILRPESYDIDKLFDAADYELTPTYPTSRLTENKSNSIFLIEANHDTADYIKGLLRLQLIDEIILYTVPFIAGTGRHLFKANLPSSHWDLIEKKEYNGGVLRIVYRKKHI